MADIVFFKGEIKENHLIILADIAKAINALKNNTSFTATSTYQTYHTPTQTLGFISKQFQELKDLAQTLNELGESDLHDMLTTLGKNLYSSNWQAIKPTAIDEVIKDNDNHTLVMYKARNGELAIRFPNKKARDDFYQQMPKGTIPSQFRTGIQYEKNPNGITPVIYQDANNRIFFPSYKATNGEFAINCGQKEVRDKLISLLNLNVSGQNAYPNTAIIKTSYGNNLFATYNQYNQLNAMYFDPNNQIFTKPGAYLKINTQTGALSTGVVANFNQSPILEYRTNDRRVISNNNNDVEEDVVKMPPKYPLKQLINDIEKKVGSFSKYKTTQGLGETIPFHQKPAQQLLKGLGAIENSSSKLSIMPNNNLLKAMGNKTVTVSSFSNSAHKLIIDGEKIDALVNSARTYVNTSIVPPGLLTHAIKNKLIKPQEQGIAPNDVHWQNLAVGICHAQEINLLISQKINEQGQAICAPSSNHITKQTPSILLLSSPALNFNYGVASKLSQKQQAAFIEGMFNNLFDAARSQNRHYIALPAAGLGVFGGDPILYFTALCRAAKSYPELNIIYHPAQFGSQFETVWQTYKPDNVIRATKDAVFIADELTKSGYPCALHNPSDSDVVYGV